MVNREDTRWLAPAKEKMRAIVQTEYGTADVLREAEIERPAIGADEVLVQVHAAGLDRGTWHLMAGMPYAARLAVGLRAPKNAVPGLDVAGVVVAVGSEVTRFQPGDEVFGVSKGSFAEFAAARERQAGAQTLEPQLRAGRRRAGLGDDRTARTLRRRPPAGRAEGLDHRRLGRRRHLRRADRQGTRSGSHRRLQHRQARPGALDRRRPRHRLQPGRLRRR